MTKIRENIFVAPYQPAAFPIVALAPLLGLMVRALAEISAQFKKGDRSLFLMPA